MIGALLKEGIEKITGTDDLGISAAIFEISAFLGLALISLSYVKFLWVGFKFIKRKGTNPLKYGKWAVVTGATDGIGKAYAFELAKRGMNVLVISRTQSKLDALVKELSEKHPKAEFSSLAIDYSKFDQEAREKVAEAISKIDDLGILINNVGMSYSFPEYFHLLSDEDVQGLLTLNIDSTVWMTRAVLPKMVEQSRGAIINLGSGAGLDPSPLLAEYSAAKVFISRFSESLNAEYESKGIFVQALTPYFVVSKLSKQRKSIFVPTPEAWVKKAMTCLGGASTENPHWAHAMVAWVFSCLPIDTVSHRVLKMHLSIRKRAYKKQERLAAQAKEEKKKN